VIEEEGSFCAACGKPLSDGADKQGATPNGKSKKPKKYIVAIIIAAAILLAGAAVLLILNPFSGGEEVDAALKGSGALTPEDEGYILPEFDSSRIAELDTGEKISAQIVFVRFKEGTDAGGMEQAAKAVGGIIAGHIPEVGHYIKFGEDKDGKGISEALGALEGLPQVEAAAPEFYAELADAPPDKYDIEALGEDEKWGFERIMLPEAWAIIRERGIDLKPVTVAVIDTGFDLDHPELKDVFLTKSNGKFRWDFGDGDEYVGPYIPNTGEDRDPQKEDDRRTHGTQVSGIIAAAVNNEVNNVGINGVAPGAKIFPLKVIDKNGGISNEAALNETPKEDYTLLVPVSRLSAAIQWAVDAGVDIISMSLGYEINEDYAWDDIAIKMALENAAEAGIVVVASAGNDGKDSANYLPASYPHVISVGATDESDKRAVWNLGLSGSSNYSDNPDALWVAAPGTKIYTTVARGNDISYDYKSGTSLSAPFVAGLAALLLQIDPSLTAQEVKDILRDTADGISVKYSLLGKSREWKRINAKKAVERVINEMEATPVETPASTPTAEPSPTSEPEDPAAPTDEYLNEEEGNPDNTMVGYWYNRDRVTETLFFENGGSVQYTSAEGITYYGTYEYDYDVGDATVVMDIKGERQVWLVLENIISGTPYLEVYFETDGKKAVFASGYPEQVAKTPAPEGKNDLQYMLELLRMDKTAALARLGPDYSVKGLAREFWILNGGVERTDYFEGFDYADKGLTLAFYPEDASEEGADLSRIQYIQCNGDYIINGARRGMTFEEIEAVLGKPQLKGAVEYWTEAGEYELFIYSVIGYEYDGYGVYFFSDSDVAYGGASSMYCRIYPSGS
jgi:subtilisin family serine protease